MASDNNAITGIDGDVVVNGYQLCEVSSWSFTPAIVPVIWTGSGSAGYMNADSSNRDATGKVTGKWNPGKPAYGMGQDQIHEGSYATLILYLDAYQYIELRALFGKFMFKQLLVHGRNFRRLHKKGLAAVGSIVDRSLDSSSAIEPNGNHVAFRSDRKKFILNVSLEIFVYEQLFDALLDALTHRKFLLPNLFEFRRRLVEEFSFRANGDFDRFRQFWQRIYTAAENLQRVAFG